MLTHLKDQIYRWCARNYSSKHWILRKKPKPFSGAAFLSWSWIRSNHKNQRFGMCSITPRAALKNRWQFLREHPHTHSLGITVSKAIWHQVWVDVVGLLGGSVQKSPHSNWCYHERQYEPHLSYILLNPDQQTGFSVVVMNLTFHCQISPEQSSYCDSNVRYRRDLSETVSE